MIAKIVAFFMLQPQYATDIKEIPKPRWQKRSTDQSADNATAPPLPQARIVTDDGISRSHEYQSPDKPPGESIEHSCNRDEFINVAISLEWNKSLQTLTAATVINPDTFRGKVEGTTSSLFLGIGCVE